jgi:glutamine synthetase
MNHRRPAAVLDHAKHYRDEVIPAMMERAQGGRPAGNIVSDDLWPLPTYQEMLFIK